VRLLVSVGVLVGGYLLTVKMIPALVVRTGRLLGFRMELNPVTRKRLARFRRIRRGYWAFVTISTFYVISLFLELLVNDKALIIYYNGKVAFPAVAQWLSTVLPFVEIPSYVKNSDFGLVGEEPVDFRLYRRYCLNPELLRFELKKRKAELEKQRESLKERGEAPSKPKPVPKPPPFAEPEPSPPPPGASPRERKAYEAAHAEWERRRDAYEEARLDAILAYDEYQDALRRWQDYQLDLKVLKDLEAEVRKLTEAYAGFKEGKAWVLLPLYPYGPEDPLLDLPGKPPYSPSWWPYLKAFLTGRPLPRDPEARAAQKILPPWSHPLGTTDNGLDVVPQVLYGFRIAVTFAVLVALLGYAVGVVVGGIMGYYGGWTDILVQRFIEIYGSIPFLYTIMILASITQPGFFLLAGMLVILRSWLGITYYVRGEFYREKAKDYVQAAIGTGVSDRKIMVKHILPNALVPVVTYAPFDVVSYMLVLVSLDYLGFGLPPQTPSWGYLLEQGRRYVTSYQHLILVPTIALAGTLFCVVVVGEAIREAFDPKVYSRLR